MGRAPYAYPNLDHPQDWREAEREILCQRMRSRLQDRQLPPWLSFSGSDWASVRLVIDGVPTGPALAWPNALFIAAWLVETR